MRSHRAYAATQRETGVSSARPIDLVVMVYERLLDHLRSAQHQMAEGTDSTESLTKAVDLITTGLEACLDKARGGEIAENLAVIYDWANREIMLARLRRDPKMLQGVINANITRISESRLGTVQRILVEGASRKSAAELMGRTECNRIVNFDAGPLGERLVGQMIDVRITQALPHSLRGAVVVSD